jgi:hypothetical protein
MSLQICPRDGRTLAWIPENERRSELNSFCSPFESTSRLFADVEIPRDLSLDWMRVENQASIGSCQGHGITTADEALWYWSTGKPVQLSRLHAYIKSQQIDGLLGRGDVGSTIAGGLELATKHGFIDESACLYRGDRYPTRDELNRITGLPIDPRYRVKSGITVKSWKHACQLLAGKMAISIGTVWPFRIDSDWVVRDWVPQGNGGHARALIGEFKNGLPGERNSWGEQWGDKGRFWWTERAFDACLRHPMTVCIALSGLESPKPINVDFAKELFQ